MDGRRLSGETSLTVIKQSRQTDSPFPTSPDTLLLMAAKPVVLATPAPTPKVLGLDDRAKLAKVPAA